MSKYGATIDDINALKKGESNIEISQEALDLLKRQDKEAYDLLRDAFSHENVHISDGGTGNTSLLTLYNQKFPVKINQAYAQTMPYV